IGSRFADRAVIVLGLPRGGVPVAAEIARALGAPLDVLLVRKVGMPGHREYAIGAVATGDIVIREPHAEAMHLVDEATFERLVAEERHTLRERERRFRGERPPPELRGRTVLLVDDGLATGSTMRAAVRAARRSGAQRVIVAVPIASREACALLRGEADEVIALETPADFFAVGQGYVDFDQVEDSEVIELLEELTPHWQLYAHGADIGVRGFGATRERAMEQAALAVTAIITDPQRVRTTTAVEIRLAPADDDTLLYDWLNAVIYEMSSRRMVFGRYRIDTGAAGLNATAWGETVDAQRHEPAAEPKGATYTDLSLAPVAPGQWRAQCVIDV
ncbi:MAG: archease, partial [Gammaproteobacteria bacterium]|nr:archease [Gammaproteobacteria bacterium]